MKLQWPVKSPWNPPFISQGFGENPQMYPGWKGHMGIDFPNQEGAPDYATHDGTVILVKESTDPHSYGFEIIYEFEEDGFTWQVLHGHHSLDEVKVGDQVKAGQEIGHVGHTGFATGPHVHLGLQQFKDGKLLNQDNGFFGFIDPMPYLTGSNTVTKKYRVQDGAKWGVGIFEGFTGTVIFADTLDHYKELCSTFGIDDSTPVITLP